MTLVEYFLKKKNSISIIIAIVLILFSTNIVLADRQVLSVPEQSQYPYNYLCWATSASMIIAYFKGDTVNRTVEIAQDKYGEINYDMGTIFIF